MYIQKKKEKGQFRQKVWSKPIILRENSGDMLSLNNEYIMKNTFMGSFNEGME